MRIALLIASILGVTSPSYAQYGSNPNSHYTNGYYSSGGTYVAPHYQTNPNSTQRDNYGTSGNYNPHTGTYGTRQPRW